MKYSFILCHRDRKIHLSKCIDSIKKHCSFNSIDYEILVVNQDDYFGFRRGALFNEGYKNSDGDILVFHDVDHIPTENVNYWDGESDVYLPIYNALFLDDKDRPRDIDDIPQGYRKFHEKVDDNFYGGVITFKRECFEKINGFNPAYCGWGLEEEDLRERIKLNNLSVKRAPHGTGTFKVLYHLDSNPGQNNYRYLYNRDIALTFKKYLEEGIHTQCYSSCNYENEFINVKDCMWGKDRIIDFDGFHLTAGVYEDNPQVHTNLWNSFKQNVNRNIDLKQHRDWVVHNQWGYGNRAFHWMWNLIFRDVLPNDFKALEIGVFKGQTISLWSLLNKYHKKNGQIYGITPLNNTGDAFSKHPDINYENAIMIIYAVFGLDASDLTILSGLSTDSNIIEEARSISEFDLLYIDGGHDYPVVKSDIENYCPMIKKGGLVVIDDASNDLNIPDGLIRMNWKGIMDVTQATKEYFDENKNYKLVFAVGHNKIYRKIT